MIIPWPFQVCTVWFHRRGHNEQAVPINLEQFLASFLTILAWCCNTSRRPYLCPSNMRLVMAQRRYIMDQNSIFMHFLVLVDCMKARRVLRRQVSGSRSTHNLPLVKRTRNQTDQLLLEDRRTRCRLHSRATLCNSFRKMSIKQKFIPSRCIAFSSEYKPESQRSLKYRIHQSAHALFL